jgi:hypothetical protein
MTCICVTVQHARVDYDGAMPEPLRRTFAALDSLLTRCDQVLDRTDTLMGKVRCVIARTHTH